MPVSADNAGLILFTRAPAPGKVKTRLIPELGADGACALHEAFVKDAVTRLAETFPLTLAVDPDPGASLFAELRAQTGATLTAQPEGDLGKRMADCLRAYMERTQQPALLMGTDMPSVPRHHLTGAAALLGKAELVFNPATDGGYYLVGASPKALSRWDEITGTVFTGIRWGSGSVLRDTLRRGEKHAIALGPCWYDVDEPADLEVLIRELRKGGPPLPHTRRMLAGAGRL